MADEMEAQDRRNDCSEVNTSSDVERIAQQIVELSDRAFGPPCEGRPSYCAAYHQFRTLNPRAADTVARAYLALISSSADVERMRDALALIVSKIQDLPRSRTADDIHNIGTEALSQSAGRDSVYSAEEKRVSEYIVKLSGGNIGAGADPIGFLIASHYALVDQCRSLKQEGGGR
jgi:hypothetical protein